MVESATDQFVVEWQFPSDPVELKAGDPTLVLNIDAPARARESATTLVLV